MANSQKGKNHKQVGQQNIIEALVDIGTQAATTLKDEAFKGADFVDNFLNATTPYEKKKYSGDIKPGESVSMKDLLSRGGSEKGQSAASHSFEKQLLNEENALIESKTQELRLQLHAIMQEVKALAQATQNMSQELKVAAMQSPVEPGVYHIIFFEKLMDTIKSFRKKIENASVWLAGMNKRGRKMNFWSRYKESKSSFLLSPEHYVQRNAG